MSDAPTLTTIHHDATLDGADRSDDWAAGVSFEAFLPTAESNETLWSSNWKRARVPEDLLARVAALPGEWRLLVLSEDWCFDAANTIPIVARFAEAAPALEMRLLARDEHLGLMDEHLTGGRARAIPAVILLDGTLRERGWWGPRPADLHAWRMTAGMEVEGDDRYREMRKWYVRDKGRSTLEEITRLIEGAAGGGHVA